jgi:hypothetical protein
MGHYSLIVNYPNTFIFKKQDPLMPGREIALIIKDGEYLGRVGEIKGTDGKNCVVALPDYSFTKRGKGVILERIQFPNESVVRFSLNGQAEEYAKLGEAFLKSIGGKHPEKAGDLEKDLAVLGINLQFE